MLSIVEPQQGEPLHDFGVYASHKITKVVLLYYSSNEFMKVTDLFPPLPGDQQLYDEENAQVRVADRPRPRRILDTPPTHRIPPTH